MTNTAALNHTDAEALLPLAIALTTARGDAVAELESLSPDLLNKLDRLGWTAGLTGLSPGGLDCLQRMGWSAVEALVSEGIYRSQVVQEG